MIAFDTLGMAKELARLSKKWVLYLSLPDDSLAEIRKAAPYLEKLEAESQIVWEGCGALLFDTEEELDAHYYATVGDDGPTKLNPYDGPCRIYAATINPQGEPERENT